MPQARAPAKGRARRPTPRLAVLPSCQGARPTPRPCQGPGGRRRPSAACAGLRRSDLGRMSPRDALCGAPGLSTGSRTRFEQCSCSARGSRRGRRPRNRGKLDVTRLPATSIPTSASGEPARVRERPRSLGRSPDPAGDGHVGQLAGHVAPRRSFSGRGSRRPAGGPRRVASRARRCPGDDRRAACRGPGRSRPWPGRAR